MHELHSRGLYLQLLGDQRSVAPHPEKECGEAESMRENLRAARKAKGMTQQQVADYLGLHERYYKSLETGERLGSIWIWDKLEDLFNVHQRVLREIHRGTADNQ